MILMKKMRKRMCCFLIVLMMTAVTTELSAMDFFLSPEEAAQLNLSENEWERPPIRPRSISNGPVIRFQSPTLSDTTHPTLDVISPISLKITFEEKNAPVDMNSLEIIAKKGFFNKSLTDRIKPFVSGTTLEAKELKIPNGKFKIQVKITDIQGSQTSLEYRMLVHD